MNLCVYYFLRLHKLTLKIITIETDEEIQACFNVLLQLRPQLKENKFLSVIRSQFKRGYQLAAVVSEDKSKALKDTVVAVAGFHFQENLAWSKYLYVEDLVTDENQRSLGAGKKLLTWLDEKAQENNCQQLHLDSGIQRKDAHRFYEREGMMFASRHYVSTF